MPSGWGYPSKSSSSKPRSSRHSSSDPTSTNPTSHNPSTSSPSSSRQISSVPESSTPSGLQPIGNRPSSSGQITSVTESSTPSGSQPIGHQPSSSRQISSVKKSPAPRGSEPIVHRQSSSRQITSVPKSSTPSDASRTGATKTSSVESGGKGQRRPKKSSSDESDETPSDESKKIPQEPKNGRAPEPGPREDSRPVRSFIISIKDLTPVFGNGRPGPRSVATSQWVPPKKAKDFDVSSPKYFRWSSGHVQAITRASEIGGELVQHSVASMFSQEPRGHLLGVYTDVSKKDVDFWRCLHFGHKKCPNVPDSGYYSYLDFYEEQRKVAAPLPTHCVPQLLPDLYDINNRRKNAGLIGKLPILIGIAAFSAASIGLTQVLTQCIKPGAWFRHDNPNGRDYPLYRGMVITICLDPKNRKGSTRDILDNLQDGEYGAFYGP